MGTADRPGGFTSLDADGRRQGNTVNKAKLRRRFLVLAVPGLAITLAITSISYLASSGAVTTTVVKSSTSFIYPVVTGGTVPAALVSGLEHTTGITTTVSSTTHTSKITAAVNPSWNPTTDSAGSVTTAGDLAIVDGSVAPVGGGLVVSMYVTNLAALQADYSSFDFPVKVYEKSCATGGPTALVPPYLYCATAATSWTLVTSTKEVKTAYLTSTTGFDTFNLTSGYLYDITITTGGSYYCTTAVSPPPTGHALAPDYYFTAQPY